MLTVERVSINRDVQRLVSDINQALWDEENEMCEYDVASLTAYLNRPDCVFVTCYEQRKDVRILMGFASARIELKPYEEDLWLYVDEVDVCVDQRKKGAGKAIMNKLIELARLAECEEVWLGTEVDNDAANALYRSLNPTEVETFVGYTFAIPPK